MESPFCPNTKLEISCSKLNKKNHPHKIFSQRIGQEIPNIIFDSISLRKLPIKLSIHKELLKRTNSEITLGLCCIQYERLNLKNLACVNSLLCQFFWPGIDGILTSVYFIFSKGCTRNARIHHYSKI